MEIFLFLGKNIIFFDLFYKIKIFIFSYERIT